MQDNYPKKICTELKELPAPGKNRPNKVSNKNKWKMVVYDKE